MPLSPDDSRPPYLQIADDLRQRIQSGEWGPGAQLPSTSHLVDAYGVARNTVRSALRILSEDGLVVARQGSGVFVRTRASAGEGSSDTVAAPIEALTRQVGALADDVRRLGERLEELERAAHPVDGTAR
jgi:DNA-binding GntR family transcriptional regulator